MGKYVTGLYPITEKKMLREGLYSITFQSKEMAERASCGQFVQVLPDKCNSLRRPISICEILEDSIRIVFEVRGEGTELLAQKEVGELLDVLGPLGHGFTVLSSDKNVICIGGGIGTPPMLEVAKQYDNATVISGFRCKDIVILQEDFEKNCKRNILCTDDGSMGIHGFVTTPLEEILKSEKIDMIYCCGPRPMLKNIALLAEKYQVPCEVSMEERMGCGIGACLVCACNIKKEDGSVYAAHVCKNGPVFSAEEVAW